jgi:hypothetical protein
VDLTDDIIVKDDRTENFTITSSDLNVGQSIPGTATYKITEADIDAGSLTNSAYATNKDTKSNTVTAKVIYEKPNDEEENNEGPGYGGALVPMPMYGSEPSGTTEVPNSCKPTVSLSKHNHKDYPKHHKAEKNC